MEIKVRSEKQISKFNISLLNLKRKYDVYIDNKLIKNLDNVEICKSGTFFLVERNFLDRKTWVFYLIVFIIFFWPMLIVTLIFYSGICYYCELFFLRFNIHNDKIDISKVDYENVNKGTIDIYVNNNICLVRGVEKYNVTKIIRKIRFAKFKVILFYICNALLWISVIAGIIYCIINAS